jgi:hypothetical protein
VNYNRADMPKSIQILFRDARAAIEAAVRADLAQNGFGDIAPAHSALLRNLGDDGSRPSDLAAHAGVTRHAIARKRMLALEREYAARVGADRWAEVRSTLEILFGDEPTRP